MKSPATDRRTFSVLLACAVFANLGAFLFYKTGVLPDITAAEVVAPQSPSATSLPERVAESSDVSVKTTTATTAAAGHLDVATVRGRGYIIGNLIKNILANRTVDSSGNGEIDATLLAEELKNTTPPVDLAQPNPDPRRRAEYLAAILSAALDQPAGIQQRIADTLNPFYARDSDGVRPNRIDRFHIAGMGAEARAALREVLPQALHAELDRITPSPKFLTMAASFQDDSIRENESTFWNNGGILGLYTDGSTDFTGPNVFIFDDGYTIGMTLAPQVVEFEGFINYGSPIQGVQGNIVPLKEGFTLNITPSVK